MIILLVVIVFVIYGGFSYYLSKKNSLEGSPLLFLTGPIGLILISNKSLKKADVIKADPIIVNETSTSPPVIEDNNVVPESVKALDPVLPIVSEPEEVEEIVFEEESDDPMVESIPVTPPVISPVHSEPPVIDPVLETPPAAEEVKEISHDPIIPPVITPAPAPIIPPVIEPVIALPPLVSEVPVINQYDETVLENNQQTPPVIITPEKIILETENTFPKPFKWGHELIYCPTDGYKTPHNKKGICIYCNNINEPLIKHWQTTTPVKKELTVDRLALEYNLSNKEIKSILPKKKSSIPVALEETNNIFEQARKANINISEWITNESVIKAFKKSDYLTATTLLTTVTADNLVTEMAQPLESVIKEVPTSVEVIPETVNSNSEPSITEEIVSKTQDNQLSKKEQKKAAIQAKKQAKLDAKQAKKDEAIAKKEQKKAATQVKKDNKVAAKQLKTDAGAAKKEAKLKAIEEKKAAKQSKKNKRSNTSVVEEPTSSTPPIIENDSISPKPINAQPVIKEVQEITFDEPIAATDDKGIVYEVSPERSAQAIPSNSEATLPIKTVNEGFVSLDNSQKEKLDQIELNKTKIAPAFDKLPMKPKNGMAKTYCPFCETERVFNEEAQCQTCGHYHQQMRSLWGLGIIEDKNLPLEEGIINENVDTSRFDLSKVKPVKLTEGIEAPELIKPQDTPTLEPQTAPENTNKQETVVQAQEPVTPPNEVTEAPGGFKYCPHCQANSLPDLFGKCTICGNDF